MHDRSSFNSSSLKSWEDHHRRIIHLHVRKSLQADDGDENQWRKTAVPEPPSNSQARTLACCGMVSVESIVMSFLTGEYHRDMYNNNEQDDHSWREEVDDDIVERMCTEDDDDVNADREPTTTHNADGTENMEDEYDDFRESLGLDGLSLLRRCNPLRPLSEQMEANEVRIALEQCTKKKEGTCHMHSPDLFGGSSYRFDGRTMQGPAEYPKWREFESSSNHSRDVCKEGDITTSTTLSSCYPDYNKPMVLGSGCHDRQSRFGRFNNSSNNNNSYDEENDDEWDDSYFYLGDDDDSHTGITEVTRSTYMKLEFV